jgi:hypothetical protein
MVRDDWIQRCLTGEHVSWTQLARDHGRNSETIRKAARRQGWKAELVQRQREQARKAYEQLQIDHLDERRRLLGVRNRLEPIAWRILERYEERLERGDRNYERGFGQVR